MAKTPLEDRKRKQEQEVRQLRASNEYPSKQPPVFQLEATKDDENPIKWGSSAGAEYEKSHDLTNTTVKGRSIAGEKGKEWGEQPEEKTVKKSVKVVSGEKQFWDESTLTEEEKKANLKGPYASTGGKGTFSLGSDGLKGGAEAEAKAMLVDYEREFPLEFDHSIFGEEMKMYLALVLKGSIGAEAKAQVEANVAKAASTGDPNKVNKSAITAGVEGGASAFVGAKLAVGGKAAYKWKKKDVSAYKQKIAQSADMISDMILMINPPLGWLLKKMGSAKAAKFLIKALFNVNGGKAGWVDLASAEAEAEGSAGIGGEAKGGIGFQDGKFSFHASAKATWGLGFGTKAKIMMDILNGVKFGLITGGEVWNRAKNYLADLIDPSAIWGAMGSLWNSIIGWFSSDNKVREMVDAGAHTLADPSKRAEMIKTMMSGFCGDDDEDRILEILRWSKENGDLWSVVGHAGYSDILSALDGAQDSEARRIMS